MQHNEAQPLEEVSLDQDAPSLGRILRSTREQQGLTLAQVSATLRIEEHLLEALEADRLDDLGPPVFVKGYIKQYGHLLGLVYEDLLERYYDAVGRREVVIKPSRTIRLRDERQITVWIITAVVLALIGVVLFLWWTNEVTEPVAFPPPDDAVEPGARFEPGDPPPPVPELATDGAAAGAAPAGGEESESGPASGPQGGAPTADGARSAGGGGAAAADGADPQREAPAAGGPAAADRFEPAAAGVASPAASDDNGAPQPATGGVRIELAFAEDSWTEVTDARGERLVYGLMRAGERASAAGPAPLSVLVGNADAVRVTVDGEPYAVPATARRGNLAEFTVGESDN